MSEGRFRVLTVRVRNGMVGPDPDRSFSPNVYGNAEAARIEAADQHEQAWSDDLIALTTFVVTDQAPRRVVWHETRIAEDVAAARPVAVGE